MAKVFCQLMLIFYLKKNFFFYILDIVILYLAAHSTHEVQGMQKTSCFVTCYAWWWFSSCVRECLIIDVSMWESLGPEWGCFPAESTAVLPLKVRDNFAPFPNFHSRFCPALLCKGTESWSPDWCSCHVP